MVYHAIYPYMVLCTLSFFFLLSVTCHDCFVPIPVQVNIIMNFQRSWWYIMSWTCYHQCPFFSYITKDYILTVSLTYTIQPTHNVFPQRGQTTAKITIIHSTLFFWHIHNQVVTPLKIYIEGTLTKYIFCYWLYKLSYLLSPFFIKCL